MKTALITGATSGIGMATAKTLAKNGFRVVICGRRADRLLALATELEKFTEVQTLQFDVRDKEDVAQKIKSIGCDIDVLINNAGNAHGLDPIETGDLADWDAMIDINVKGLLYVSHAVIDGMTKRKSGHIINIGSTAAKEVYPKGNVYCASKHAVDAITEGMRLDLNPYGIKVGAIHPGMVATEFSEIRFKGDKERAKTVYQGFQPLMSEDIADIVLFVVTRPYHVNIADLMVMSTDQASSTIVNRNRTTTP